MRSETAASELLPVNLVKTALLDANGDETVKAAVEIIAKPKRAATALKIVLTIL
jgi:hypothetical protein